MVFLKTTLFQHPDPVGIQPLEIRGWGPVASKVAPCPIDPEWMSGRIKKTAYFLRTDLVGTCEFPSYAVYSWGAWHGGEKIQFNHK